jgi:hypothetical protein
MGTKRGFGFAIVVALLGLGACKTPVADYCEQSSDCTDLGKPFCDVNGDYDESDHIGRTCIPFPDDATKDFCLDDDRDCPAATPVCGADRVCRGCTSSAECGDSAGYCDVANGTCLACEPDKFQRCDGADLVVCNAAGTGEDVTTCSTSCDATEMRCDDCTPDAFLGCTDGTTASICSSTGVPTDTNCAHACNATDMRCEQCEPSTATCDPDLGDNGSKVTCDSVGQVSSTQSCYVSCEDVGDGAATCLDLDPSNELASYLDMAETAADVVITGNQTIDTSTGAVSGTSITNFLVVGAGTNKIRVYVVKSLTQSGTLRVIGDHPIAIISHGNVTIRGHINVSASGPERAAGSREVDSLGCIGKDGGGDPASPQDGLGGGGGGSFGAAGAAGGASTFGGYPGGVPGDAEGLGTGTFEPLRAGCRGGGSGTDGTIFGGAGGGAIQISTRAAIVFGDAGFVTASGGGGNTSGATDESTGGGGGSGGAILLEAPYIRSENVGVNAGIFANGGGGGCIEDGGAAHAGGDPGLDGNGGGGAVVCGPDGGNGASSSAAATAGLEATTSNAPSGGGGGGGLGAIGVRGTYQDTGSILTSPLILEMPLNVRIQ